MSDVLRGFKSFLMQGNVIIAAIGLAIALAFSTLVAAFTSDIITPLVNAAGGGGTNGLGFTVKGQHVDVGAFVSAIIYFVVCWSLTHAAKVLERRIAARRAGLLGAKAGAPAPIVVQPLSAEP